MLQFGNKEFRNLQEQVEKNKEDIESLRSGGIKISAWLTENQLAEYITEEHVGNYVIVSRSGVDHLYVITKRLNGGLIADDLGEYPKAIEGPQGEKGEQGDKGEPGREILSFGSQLPRAENFENGQLALLTAGIHKGRLSKVVDGQWVTQCSLIGPQGPIGENGTEVVGNPDNAANDTLTKIKIAGVTYKVSAMSDTDKEFLDRLREYIEIDESGNVTFGNGIYVDGTADLHRVNATRVHSTGDITSEGEMHANATRAEETFTDLIQSDTSTSLGQKVEFAHFDSNDNHWHQSNTKFDDDVYAPYIEIQTGDIADLYSHGNEVELQDIHIKSATRYDEWQDDDILSTRLDSVAKPSSGDIDDWYMTSLDINYPITYFGGVIDFKDFANEGSTGFGPNMIEIIKSLSTGYIHFVTLHFKPYTGGNTVSCIATLFTSDKDGTFTSVGNLAAWLKNNGYTSTNGFRTVTNTIGSGWNLGTYSGLHSVDSIYSNDGTVVTINVNTISGTLQTDNKISFSLGSSGTAQAIAISDKLLRF